MGKYKDFKYIDSVQVDGKGNFKIVKASDENGSHKMEISISPDTKIIEVDFSENGKFAPVSKTVLNNKCLTAKEKGVYATLIAYQLYNTNLVVFNNAAFCELFDDDPRTIRNILEKLEGYNLIKSYDKLVYRGNRQITYTLLPPSEWNLPNDQELLTEEEYAERVRTMPVLPQHTQSPYDEYDSYNDTSCY